VAFFWRPGYSQPVQVTGDYSIVSLLAFGGVIPRIVSNSYSASPTTAV
jgi:hypothetical protein